MSELPGAHLALPEDGEISPGESIVKVVQRFVFKSFAWVGIYLLGKENVSSGNNVGVLTEVTIPLLSMTFVDRPQT